MARAVLGVAGIIISSEYAEARAEMHQEMVTENKKKPVGLKLSPLKTSFLAAFQV